MIGVLFPLEHEAALFLRKAKAKRLSVPGLRAWKTSLPSLSEEVIAGVLWMGEACRASTRRFVSVFEPRLVVLAGYAGGLVPELRLGEVCLAENFSTQLPPTHFLQEWGIQVCAGAMASDIVATPEARRALACSTGAKIVDMESDFVLREVREKGVSLLVLRVVSDPFERVLPVAALHKAFGNGEGAGAHRALGLLLHFALHPGELPPFVGFVLGLGRARSALTETLLALLHVL
jgi:hypothetical protein